MTKKFPVALEKGYSTWESKTRSYVNSNYGELIQANIRESKSDSARVFETGNETVIVPLNYVAPNNAIGAEDSKVQPLLILTDVGRIIIERIKSEEHLFKPDKWQVLEATSRAVVVKNIKKTFAQIAKKEIENQK